MSVYYVYHIVFEDGYWSLWYDGRIVGRYHTREEAEAAASASEGR